MVESVKATGSQAIERALAILECFTPDHPNISVGELITQTGLTMPTVHRIVRALERRHFLFRDPHTNRYSVGPAIVELARMPLQQTGPGDLVAVALPYLEALRDMTSETVGLHVLLGDERVCAAELVSHEPIRMASGVGSVRPLGRGAAGKVLAAYLLAVPVSPRQNEDSLVLSRDDAAMIREQGYAMSFGETVVGASAIAVPVLGPGDGILAAINITGPVNRWTRDQMSTYLEGILGQSLSLSARLAAPQAPAEASDSRQRPA
jgi:IclR family transcriptional regulator, KDG regulon repressor